MPPLSRATEVDEVLGVIRAAGLTMEQQADESYALLKETGLRHILLVGLRGRGLHATSAETHNRGGHTDLIVRDGARTVLIVECKIWSGASRARRALDQLLGYATWRDRSLALVFFVREQDIETIIERAAEALTGHPGVFEVLPERPDRDLHLSVGVACAPKRRFEVSVQFVHVPGELVAPPSEAERDAGQTAIRPGGQEPVTDRASQPARARATQVLDPVFGSVSLSAAQAHLLAHPALQRLRGQSQLGLVQLVYPGAGHGRLEQLLGAWACGEMLARAARSVGTSAPRPISEEELRWMQALTVVDQLARMPFADPLQDLLSAPGERADVLRQALDESDGRAGALRDRVDALVAPSGSTGGPRPSDALVAVLTGAPDTRGDEAKQAPGLIRGRLLADFLLGPAGATQVAQVLRDTHHVGLPGAQFDLARLADGLVLARQDVDRRAFDSGSGGRPGRGSLESLVLAEHYFQEKVLEHRAYRAATAMLERACVVLIESGERGKSRRLTLERRLTTASDVSALQLLTDAAAGVAGELGAAIAKTFECVRNRELPKQVVTLNSEELGDSDAEVCGHGGRAANARDALARELEARLALPTLSVFVHGRTPAQPRALSAPVLVDGQVRPLSSVIDRPPAALTRSPPGLAAVRIYAHGFLSPPGIEQLARALLCE